MRRFALTWALCLAGCGSNTTAPPPNTVGGYPFAPQDVSYVEGTCQNGLSCLLVTATDAPGTCTLQQANQSSDAFYHSSTIALFELYAAVGVPTPLPSGTYTVLPAGSSLGGGPSALVTFYKLDPSCGVTLQAPATNGSVTLGTTGTVLDYAVGFQSLGALNGSGVTATLCNISPDTGTPYCI
ncbi:MAG TPA: hypothetical protein VEJ89_08945 [Myxococcaceae bacterium]|jgi:hypothetical protein|nr:hypothetical protein [Myxococcaceae bacterium]